MHPHAKRRRRASPQVMHLCNAEDGSIVGAAIRKPNGRMLAVAYDDMGDGRSLGEFGSLRAALDAFEKKNRRRCWTSAARKAETSNTVNDNA